MLARPLISFACLVVMVTPSFSQTPLLTAAAVMSEEQPSATLASLSKQQAIKAFTPLLRSSPESAGFVVAAFALAMKGVDVDANLARLAIPIKSAQQEKIEELTASHGLAENQIMLGDIPNGIYLIYKTRKHPPALKNLLTMQIPWPATESRDDCVMTQLAKDPKPVLAMAANDPRIYAALWDIVDWNVGSMYNRKMFIHRMQTARWTTAAMKQTALKLANDLKIPKNRPHELDGIG